MVTLETINQARERIAPYIHKTPLLNIKNLEQYLGCKAYFKMESLQKTNSFKVRGATNRLMTLSKEDLDKGIVTASSGNHGKATAYAAKQLGVKARVVVPNNAPAVKVAGIRSYGAEIVESIPAERFSLAEKLANENNWKLISPFDDYEVMSGQGTAGLEILEQLADVDTVIVPIGGGGLLGGISAAIKLSNPKVKVIGVEPTTVARYTESFKAGERVTLPADSKSVADGLQSLYPGVHNYPVIQKYVDEIVTVDEEYILKASKLMLTEGKMLTEISSCATLAAVMQGKIKVDPAEKVVFFMSGGNIGMDQFSKFENVEL